MAVDISIIIPCFNRVELLKETIKSVAQAIESLHAEIILVDDGSDIPISEQITEFSNLPIVHIRQKNAGLTTSRYNGLLAAKGEYIQFLDSDDRVAAAKFKVQIEQMRQTGADVSHTDVLHCRVDIHNNKIVIEHESSVQDTLEPSLFYIGVQPTPHSPIFKRAYITPLILKSFIALNREYDPIAEAWFYYNLSIYPAKIIKVNQPLTLYIHHSETRITSHWEWQALSALSLMHEFIIHAHKVPKNYINTSKKQVAIAAFKTYRGLPGNIDIDLQEAFISIWQRLGKCAIKDLGGGKYFSFLSEIIGPVTVAKLFKKLNHNDYRNTKTVTQSELNSRLRSILNKLAINSLEK
ncbi:MAG: glycosyl transferase [Mucilaginibacter sp.]|nr:glycosyl transferase [Mucilaginibacter sp.]